MNVIDEYDRGEPARDARRMTTRWKADGRNVMTDDGPDEKALHIATFASPDVAEHIVGLHNRTLGDGQEPPPPLVDSTDARRWARGFMQLSATTEMDEGAMLSWFANALETGRRAGQRERRQLSHTLVHVDVRQRVMEMVESLVQERVTAYAAREPARLVIDGDPVAMANVLSKLGYFVAPPDAKLASFPPDYFAQVDKARRDLAQDIAEQVPGATQALTWFESTQHDATTPVDGLRKAFLAGYDAAARLSAEGMNP